MAINDTSEFVVYASLNVNGAIQTYIHTLHFRSIATPAGGSVEAVLIDRWQAAARTAWLAAHTSSYNMVAIVARQVCGSTPLRAPAFESDTSAGSRAAPAGDQLAHWLSCVVTEYTDLAGRSRRGRFFLSNLFEADVQGNQILSGYTTLVSAYNTALLGAFGPSGTDLDFRLVVHSRKLASVPGTQCQDSSRIVTSLTTRTGLTTQRSRRPRAFA